MLDLVWGQRWHSILAVSNGTPAINRSGIRDVFYGPEFNDHEMETALATSGLNYRRCPQLETEVARLLSRGHVVARFHGRMEYGPRALGNRSILCHPGRPKSQ